MYVTVVAGVLFLAFAYFAVGQAAVTRNGAQTAADAAALAAAQDFRDRLGSGFLKALGDGRAWEDILQGRSVGMDDACAEAQWFAGKNGADVTTCASEPGPPSFTVRVRTRGTVGDSIIPGTESRHASARARAVVRPRCSAEPPASGEGRAEDEPIRLECDGRPWLIDPKRPDALPDAADLFTVRLAD